MILRRFALILLLFFASSNARQARCIGTFALGKRCAPASMDIYSSRLSPERIDRRTVVRVTVRVGPSFDQQAVIDCGGRILRRQGSMLFISCGSGAVEKIAALPGVESCSVSRKPQPLMDSVRIQCRINEVHGTVPPNALPGPYTGKGVLAGILDTDFDTRHPAFIDSNGHTRFIAIWDQHDSTGAKLNRFGYGAIKFRNELLVDTAFGLAEGSHGTHTSSTVAGSDWASGYYGAAVDATIIGVRYGGEAEIADGLKWICEVADSLNLPCVVNMSIGIARGPHDGTSSIDRMIDSLSGPGRIIVGAAGNDGASYSHILCSLAPQASKSTWAQFSVDSSSGTVFCNGGADFWGEQGKNFTGSFLLMDMRTFAYRESNDSFTTSRTRLYDEDTILWNDSLSGRVDTFFMQYGVERSNEYNEKTHMVVFAASTNPHLTFGITVTNPSSASATVIHGWNVTKRSFISAGLQGFEGGDSLYTINEIGGTAKRNITVGGYTGRSAVPLWDGNIFNHDCTLGDIFISSGVGPTVDGRIKPDITAPAWSVVAAISRNASRDRTEVARWPDTSNTFSRYGAETGTSMSAPIVSGIVALLLQADPTLTPEAIKTLFYETAIKDSHTGALTERSNKWGAGKVNAFGAVARLLDISVTKSRETAGENTPPIRTTRGGIVLPPAIPPSATFELIDLRGRIVFMRQNLTAARITIPSTLTPGAYIVYISDANRKVCARLHMIIMP
ncbi:MAG: S8 family serine peptidase [Chitinispirillaceae bacterium]|nr:S8 family serine peptidase [Chitinispirillaceae bacterium]